LLCFRSQSPNPWPEASPPWRGDTVRAALSWQHLSQLEARKRPGPRCSPASLRRVRKAPLVPGKKLPDCDGGLKFLPPVVAARPRNAAGAAVFLIRKAYLLFAQLSVGSRTDSGPQFRYGAGIAKEGIVQALPEKE
jgi:hypothetical protein